MGILTSKGVIDPSRVKRFLAIFAMGSSSTQVNARPFLSYLNNRDPNNRDLADNAFLSIVNSNYTDFELQKFLSDHVNSIEVNRTQMVQKGFVSKSECDTIRGLNSRQSKSDLSLDSDPSIINDLLVLCMAIQDEKQAFT